MSGQGKKERPGVSKRVEVLLEMSISDAMTSEVHTVGPDAMMSELRHILRSTRTSGIPVVEDEQLVGIISVEDFINHLMAREGDCPVGERMTRNPSVVHPGQPLLHAVKRFDQTGFGRFPVVEPGSRRLVGILTRTDIIHGALKRLEEDFVEEEERRYRASHIFRDIVADYEELHLRYKIEGRNFEDAGRAATNLKKNVRRLGARPEIIRRVAIAAYEAEMNVVIYGGGGTLDATISSDRVCLVFSDSGPGISDVEKALEPGFTTSEEWVRDLGFGAGMGLSNIGNCSDTMEIQSAPGEGTILRITVLRKEGDTSG